MRLVGSFPAVYYTLVLSIRQLPTNFSAITVGACNRPQRLLACNANLGVNFLLGSKKTLKLKKYLYCIIRAEAQQRPDAPLPQIERLDARC